MASIRTARARLLLWALPLLLGPIAGGAQQADSVRAGMERPRPPADQRPQAQAGRVDALRDTAGPPITPRRAFLYSFLLPGAGQAKLDRGYAGGMFFLIEVSALALVHRSAEDLRIARRFAGDSVPLTYQTDPVTGVVARDTDGHPIVATWERSRYTLASARTRRLHLEDWTAVLIFNHLFAGADAFVAAQLWDLPERLEVRQTPDGLALLARIRFGAAPRR